MTYAIISIGGKQYRVQEGERLLVDRLAQDEGKTFSPDVLLVGGDGGSTATVTARVTGHVRGKKIRIGKYRPKTGYRRHTGFRAALTQIEIESIGAKKAAAKKAQPAPKEEAKAEAPKRTAHPPKGYEEMTIADIKEGVGSWRRPQIEAALEYEREHGNRKGAIAASAVGKFTNTSVRPSPPRRPSTLVL